MFDSETLIPRRVNNGVCREEEDEATPLQAHLDNTMQRGVKLLRMMSTAARISPRPPWTPPSDLRYPLREIDQKYVSASNWVAPMGIDETLPFRVFRTEKGKQVPVYTDYRNGRTRCLTIVRRIRGDTQALADELSKVCDGNPVDIRPGRIQVKGNYRGRVVEWLLRLGF